MSSLTVTPGPPDDSGTPISSDVNKVSWAPPILVDPLDVTFSADLQRITLPSNKDARIHLPSTPLLPTSALEIIGGHHIVLIGGEIDGGTQASLQITGTAAQRLPRIVHVEGVKMTGALNNIEINAHNEPGLVVRLQNINATASSINISAIGPPRVLQIDRMDATTGITSLDIRPASASLATPTTWTYRRCHFDGRSSTTALLAQNSTKPTNVLDRFYLSPNPALPWPSQVLGLDVAYWPGAQLTPADFTTWLSGNPGVGYIQPGYLLPA